MRVSYDVDFWLRKRSRKIWKLDVQVSRWFGCGTVMIEADIRVPSEGTVKRKV
jgi:hypothetical protein